ncbi:MAG: hypothetical protein GYB31_05825 [Bacteroidetes bacterium]|nr:hypothetical protein [Bacteroidota bacterium]
MALFALIASLNGPEKTYFRKQALAFAGEKLPAYLELFDAIIKGVSDEDLLRKRFGQGRSNSYYPTLRRYLYDQLLKSLSEYHQKYSRKAEAEQSLKNAGVLFDRKLYEAGLAELKRAQKLAYKLEYFSLLIESLRLESKILGLHLRSGWLKQKKEINGELQRLIGLQEQEAWYFNLYDHLYSLSRQEPGLRKPEHLEELNRMMKDPRIQLASKPGSIRARLLFNGIHYTFLSMQGKYRQAYSFSRENLRLWRTNPLLRQDRFKDFLSSFFNHLNRCYHLKKATEMRELLNELSLLTPPKASSATLLAVRRCLYELNYLELSGNYSEFEEVSSLAQKVLEKQCDSIPLAEHRLLLYNLAWHHFLREEFDRALTYCIRLESLSSGSKQIYLLRFARLLMLILHFELGNYQLLDNILHTHQASLKRKGSLSSFESLFLQMLREFVSKVDLYNTPLPYAKYLDSFEALRRNSFEKQAFQYLDISRWLKARQAGKKILDK